MKVEKGNFVMWAAAALLFKPDAVGMTFDSSRRDFRIYYFTRQVFAGQAYALFGVESASHFSMSGAEIPPVLIDNPNVYPPYLLPLFVPLSLLSYTLTPPICCS